jgi:membrane protein insertase Oxa1/YidC/SpoIIIJ
MLATILSLSISDRLAHMYILTKKQKEIVEKYKEEKKKKERNTKKLLAEYFFIYKLVVVIQVIINLNLPLTSPNYFYVEIFCHCLLE